MTGSYFCLDFILNTDTEVTDKDYDRKDKDGDEVVGISYLGFIGTDGQPGCKGLPGFPGDPGDPGCPGQRSIFESSVGQGECGTPG